MIKIPSLPFASSIAGGEPHACIKPYNETVFNMKYFAQLYKIHQDDIPQLLSEKLSGELAYYVEGAHKDLAVVMFERMLTLESKGIVSTPVMLRVKKEVKTYATVVYHFSQSDEKLTAVISLINNSGEENIDCPFLAFTAERMPDSIELCIEIDAEVEIPLMLKHGKSLAQIHDIALYWIKFICAFEAMFAYECIKFKSFHFDAMLEKKGVCLNPNFVQVNLLALKSEEMDII